MTGGADARGADARLPDPDPVVRARLPGAARPGVRSRLLVRAGIRWTRTSRRRCCSTRPWRGPRHRRAGGDARVRRDARRADRAGDAGAVRCALDAHLCARLLPGPSVDRAGRAGRRGDPAGHRLAQRGVATRGSMARAQEVATRTYAAQDAMLAAAESVRALGMRRALVAPPGPPARGDAGRADRGGFRAGGYFHRDQVRAAGAAIAGAGWRVLGALLAVDNKISGGAIFRSSFLIARALAPIEL